MQASPWKITTALPTALAAPLAMSAEDATSEVAAAAAAATGAATAATTTIAAPAPAAVAVAVAPLVMLQKNGMLP